MAIARSDWLLLFIAFEGAPEGLDPVRIQEGLFLFSRCPGAPPGSHYAFEPGIYGPISDDLDSDLDRLADDGWFELVPVKGAHWRLHKPTDATFDRARRILRRTDDEGLLDAVRELFEVKRYVSSVAFGELLEHLYTEHPDFAVNSVFRRAS
ncbi:MAG: hypothetical protein ACHQHO_05170 [Solirubrobacterales bacterium]